MLLDMSWLCQCCLISFQSLVILNRFNIKKEKQMFVTSATMSPQLRAAVNQSAKPETAELNEFLFFLFFPSSDMFSQAE